MSLPRMIAALAAAIAFGAIVATFAGAEAALLAPLTWFVAFVAALAIAAIVVVPVVAVRAFRGGSARPGSALAATALAIGGLVVFPVYTNFYSDADAAAEGGGVGYCSGLLPLANVVRNAVVDEPVGELYYSAGCDD